MIASIVAIAFLSTIVWGHHMFVSGMNPFLGSVFTFTTLLIAIPSAVKAFNYITTLWKGNLQMNPAMLFSIGLVSTISVLYSWANVLLSCSIKLNPFGIFIDTPIFNYTHLRHKLLNKLKLLYHNLTLLNPLKLVGYFPFGPLFNRIL
jgi:hypothetical protein